MQSWNKSIMLWFVFSHRGRVKHRVLGGTNLYYVTVNFLIGVGFKHSLGTRPFIRLSVFSLYTGQVERGWSFGTHPSYKGLSGYLYRAGRAGGLRISLSLDCPFSL